MKKRWFLLILLLWPRPAAAQSPNKMVPELGFAHFDRNRITLFADSSAFEKLFVKMDSVYFLGKGNLRIAHLGGSHVQAGTFTGQLRKNLLSLGPGLDGGRGLVFPFSAARTNNPSSFLAGYSGKWQSVKSTERNPGKRLGLTGMALSTSDPKASVTLTLIAREPKPGDPAFRFNRVRVLGFSSGGNRTPVILSGQRDTLYGVHASDTSGWDFILPALTDSVKIGISGTSGEWTLTGIFLDNPFPGITVSEIGVNGAALSSYFRCQDLRRDLRLVRPDLAILAIGINDASGMNFSEEEFMQRYRILVDEIKAASPSCTILFVTNNDSFRRIRRRGYHVNVNGVFAEDAFLRLGKEYDAGVWDLFDIMGGLESMAKWEAAALAKPDKIHFTEQGYELLGDLMFNALMDRYVEHLKQLR